MRRSSPAEAVALLARLARSELLAQAPVRRRMLTCDRGADQAVSTLAQATGAAATRPANATVQSPAPRARACRRGVGGRPITLRSGVRGVQGLATWQPQVAAFALRAGRVDFRVSPGRAAASTTRSRPPRSSGARSAAHAGHLSTRKCCVGRGGVGSERSAPAPQGALERACARLRTSRQPAELIGEPRAARATPGRAHRATPRRGQPARELVTSSAREQAAEGTT